MSSMSGAVRKRRVTLLAIFAVIFITIYTFWDKPDSVADILSPWEGPAERELELQRAQESQNLLQHVPKSEDQRQLEQAREESPERQIQDVDLDLLDQFSETTINPIIQPVVGKITISFGEREEVYERAIRSHEFHNKEMGYSQFVLRERLVPGLWSKHAYIFSIIVQEMTKPEDQRLKWLMWLDRDTVLMNALLPLEMFIPPPGFDHIHLLTTNDRHGLNNGVFLVKVCEWSLKLFSTALTFPHYNPNIKLKYSEQSAMEEVLKVDWYNRSTVRVPQRWFNAFPPPPAGAKLNTNHARPGDLLFHFASNRDGLRPERMNKWMDVADQEISDWSVPLNETNYPQEIDEYWRRLRKHEDVGSIIADIEKHG